MNAKKLTAALAACGAAWSLAACGNNAESDSTASSKATETSVNSESSAEAAPAAEMPTSAELNAVLTRASDPALPMEERVNTVQGGQTAPEIFDLMAQSQQDSGANFQVVDPVLPGYSPNTVLATVNFTQPDQATQLAENVEFIYEDGHWKLSQSWACTLVTNTLPPEQVPPMCHGPADAPPADAPAEAPEAGFPAEDPAQAPVEAPVEAPPAL